MLFYGIFLHIFQGWIIIWLTQCTLSFQTIFWEQCNNETLTPNPEARSVILDHFNFCLWFLANQFFHIATFNPAVNGEDNNGCINWDGIWLLCVVLFDDNSYITLPLQGVLEWTELAGQRYFCPQLRWLSESWQITPHIISSHVQIGLIPRLAYHSSHSSKQCFYKIHKRLM